MLWRPYQDFHQLVDKDARRSLRNPLFKYLEPPGIDKVLSPASPLMFSLYENSSAQTAPVMGEGNNWPLCVGLNSEL